MRIRGIKQNRIHSAFQVDSINKKLSSRKQLIIKSGIDPSSPDAHLGHIVGILLLREFQQLGHKVVFIIGDFTAQLGDGLKRKKLSFRQTKKNCANHIKLVKLLLDSKNLEIHRQSEWLEKMKTEELIDHLSKITAKRLLSHDTFQKRLSLKNPLKTHELIYPFFMAIDSVITKTDIEIGSIEQKFNFKITREFMRKSGINPQDFILNKRLPGIDGSEKMSKSEGNFIGIFEEPMVQIKKFMRLPDNLIATFFTLLTNKGNDEIKEIRRLSQNQKSFKDLKKELVFEVLKLFHDKNTLQKAWKNFQAHGTLEVIQLPNKKENVNLLDFLTRNKLVLSKRETKRLILQGAIRINNKKSRDFKRTIHFRSGDILNIGKSKIIKIT